MENIEDKVKIYKFNCIDCNYHTDRPCDWIKHIESEKHERKGKKKTTKCDLCDYVGLTHWNLKLHNTIHMLVEICFLYKQLIELYHQQT